MRNQVQVEQPRVTQPLAITAEQGMRCVTRRWREQALARTERLVVGQAQRPGRLRADDAAEFLEKRVSIHVAQ